MLFLTKASHELISLPQLILQTHHRYGNKVFHFHVPFSMLAEHQNPKYLYFYTSESVFFDFGNSNVHDVTSNSRELF